MMKSGVYFIVMALLVAELFNILISKLDDLCYILTWTQSGAESQKNEYLS